MSDSQENQSSDQPGVDRLIGLSDAVVAVAITLMALEIKVPEGVPASQLPQALIETRTTFLSYVYSFLVVAVYWIEHHRMFRYIKRYDIGLVWLNLLFLFLIVLVPFGTDLIDRYGDQQLAVLIYASLMAAIGLVMVAIWRYATYKHRLVAEDLSPRVERRGIWLRLVPPTVFLASIPVTFLSVDVAMYMWLGIFPLMMFAHTRV